MSCSLSSTVDKAEAKEKMKDRKCRTIEPFSCQNGASIGFRRAILFGRVECIQRTPCNPHLNRHKDNDGYHAGRQKPSQIADMKEQQNAQGDHLCNPA
jgi:hypothetical protein